MNEYLSPVEYQKVFRPPLSVLDFVHNALPTPLPATQRLDEYHRLSEIPIMAMKFELPENEGILLVGMARPIRGMEISALSHFGAPNKSFGFDAEDFINDREVLFDSRSAYSMELLHNHRQIPNWHIFERIQERVGRVVEDDFENSGKGISRLIPIVQILKKDKNTSLHLTLHPAVVEYLESSAFDGQTAPLEIYMPELGPLLLSAYSPEITSKWPRDDSYSRECRDRNIHQRIAATQFIPYSLARAPELVESRFAVNLAQYADTGHLLGINSV